MRTHFGQLADRSATGKAADQFSASISSLLLTQVIESEHDAILAARKGDVQQFLDWQWPGVHLDPFQRNMIDAGMDPISHSIWVKGNAGCGKGAAAAILVCMIMTCWPDSKTVITRDSHDKARTIMFGEIAKWWRRMADPPRDCVLKTSMIQRVGRDSWVKVANPGSDEGFSGVHASHVFILFDEATAAILEPRFRLALTQATKFMAMANPRVRAGTFHRAFPAKARDKNQTVTSEYGPKTLITIGGIDCRNVREKRLEKAVAPIGGITIGKNKYRHGRQIPPEDYAKVRPIVPGQVCYDTWMGHKAQPEWWSRIFADGLFPESDPEKQVINTDWIDDAIARWKKWHAMKRQAVIDCKWKKLRLIDRMLPVNAFSLDVGMSFGGNASCLSAGGEKGIREQYIVELDDGIDVGNWVLDTVKAEYDIDLKAGGIPIAIDYGGGYGNAVGDPLKRKGVRVIEVRGNETPTVDPRVYGNRRAEMYGELGARLDPKGRFRGVGYMLPEDTELEEDLGAPEKVYKGDEALKYFISPKAPRPGHNVDDTEKIQSVHSMLGRSPDKGDSAAMLWIAVEQAGVSLDEWIKAGALV